MEHSAAAGTCLSLTSDFFFQWESVKSHSLTVYLKADFFKFE